MKTLMELACEFRPFTDKKNNAFFPFYEELFPTIRETTKVVLEIGIRGAGSLALWHDFFDATIYGIDVNPKSIRRVGELNRPKIHPLLLDQSDRKGMTEFAKSVGSFDLIIDDGSHLVGDQIASFEVLWPFLRKGGYYCIEDMQSSFRDKYINQPVTTAEYFKDISDYILNSAWLGGSHRLDRNKNYDRLIYVPSLIAIRKKA